MRGEKGNPQSIMNQLMNSKGVSVERSISEKQRFPIISLLLAQGVKDMYYTKDTSMAIVTMDFPDENFDIIFTY